MARILIIDDQDSVRSMLRHMLETADYDVVEAADGRQGIERYKEDRADLVITDIVMPEKDGIETIMELCRDDPDARIIAISGGGRWVGKDYLEMAGKLGARRVLPKPVKRVDLLRAVRDTLGE